jgi:hypothetical protein
MLQVWFERRGLHRDLVGKTDCKCLLWRLIRKWKDVNKMDLQEVECGIMDWIDVAQDKDRFQALMNAVMKHPVPYNAGNFLTS